MAQAAYSETQLQQIIHTLYEGNTSYPAATDDDYLSRRNIMNEGIMKWDLFKGTLWNELWTPSASGDGDQTITAGKTAYALPSDFRFFAGLVRLIDANNAVTFYTKIKEEDADKYEGQTWPVFYISGSAKAGFKLNFLPGSGSNTFPSSAQLNNTLKYEYYKRPVIISGVNDVPDMSNPNFLIHYALSYLYRQDDNFDAADREMQVADSMLSGMQTVNTMASWREDDHIRDGLFDDKGFPGFGK